LKRSAFSRGLLIPVDTSECERVFSLMNDLKTAERSSLGQQTLKNLMLWHVVGKKMECKDVPVMAILKEFREMAGPADARPIGRPRCPSTATSATGRAPPPPLSVHLGRRAGM
jgi:hypothetical protein